MGVSYLSPKATAQVSALSGFGVFATAEILPGEVVVAFGGRTLARPEFGLLPISQQQRSVQIEDDLYLAAGHEPEPADFVNHSCAPNCQLSGAAVIVAARRIAVGEELTFEYATANSSDFQEFECGCATAACRSKVTAHDWMLPELQRQHRGSFSPYLARRINRLVGATASRRAFAY